MLNANGDEIICKGIFSIKDYLRRVALLTILFTLLTMGFLLVTLPCFIIMYISVAKNWELYLTPTEIHYNAGCQYFIVPLNQVNHISVIPRSSTILINKKNLSVHATSNSVTVTNDFRIPYVDNCHEFVAAVRAEINSH